MLRHEQLIGPLRAAGKRNEIGRLACVWPSSVALVFLALALASDCAAAAASYPAGRFVWWSFRPASPADIVARWFTHLEDARQAGHCRESSSNSSMLAAKVGVRRMTAEPCSWRRWPTPSIRRG